MHSRMNMTVVQKQIDGKFNKVAYNIKLCQLFDCTEFYKKKKNKFVALTDSFRH